MEGREARRFQRRVRLILTVFLGGLGLVAVRAAQLQVEQHDHLARLARDQYLNTVKIPARRGNIYDRAGAPLAISVDVPSVYANPAAVSDARG
ncbi:MAG TPA: penicillin-binding protein, partial [Myxococcota bacterium]|nr:penicillin-binding protein [Myxococcota bacterium]